MSAQSGSVFFVGSGLLLLSLFATAVLAENDATRTQRGQVRAAVDRNRCLTVGDGIVAAVRTGIVIERARDLVDNGPPGHYPKILDKARNRPASPNNRFFTLVIDGGIAEPEWSKQGMTYIQTCPQQVRRFQYDPKAGTFLSIR